MSQVTQTAEEVMDSLTGHDEAEIATQFGRNVGDLWANDATLLARALVFVSKRRAGLNDDDARNFAMALTFKELNNSYFADESEADDEAGKGEQLDEQPPVTSPSGASEPVDPETSI